MSKKKRTGPKKHNISQSHLVGTPATVALTPSSPKTATDQLQTSITAVNDTAFVLPEVRKVLLLAATFIAVEVLLWVVFTHTGLGNTIYTAVKP